MKWFQLFFLLGSNVFGAKTYAGSMQCDFSRFSQNQIEQLRAVRRLPIAWYNLNGNPVRDLSTAVLYSPSQNRFIVLVSELHKLNYNSSEAARNLLQQFPVRFIEGISPTESRRYTLRSWFHPTRSPVTYFLLAEPLDIIDQRFYPSAAAIAENQGLSIQTRSITAVRCENVRAFGGIF